MSEIITIQLGQCGNQLGLKFWEAICEDHCINDVGRFEGMAYEEEDRLAKIQTYFQEDSEDTYSFRSVNVDPDAAIEQVVTTSKYSKLFPEDSVIKGEWEGGSSGVWAKAYYEKESRMSETVLEYVRKISEKCDRLQGFQLMHALGGGTGAGMGSLLLKKLKDEYPKQINMTFSVFPSQRISETETVIELYNTVLSLRHLTEFSDFTVCLDNESLYAIAMRMLGVETPSLQDLNQLTSNVLSDTTSYLRFSDQGFSDLHDLSSTLVPRSPLRLLTCGSCPLKTLAKRVDFTLTELVEKVFTPDYAFSGADGRRAGVNIQSAVAFRGTVVEEAQRAVRVARADDRDRVVASVCPFKHRGVFRSATRLSNDTGVTCLLAKLREQYQHSCELRTLYGWYVDEGMPESEFDDAMTALDDVIAKYNEIEASPPPPRARPDREPRQTTLKSPTPPPSLSPRDASASSLGGLTAKRQPMSPRGVSPRPPAARKPLVKKTSKPLSSSSSSSSSSLQVLEAPSGEQKRGKSPRQGKKPVVKEVKSKPTTKGTKSHRGK